MAEQFSSINFSIFSQHLQSTSTRNAHELMKKQHSTRHELLKTLKESKSKEDCKAEEDEETDQSPLEYATEDSSEGADKNTRLTDDTVTFVTACRGTVAWGSKQGKEYGVFICDEESGEVHLDQALFFECGTNNMVQALDFNASSESFQMVGVDFGKQFHLFAKGGGQEGEEHKGETKDGEWSRLYSTNIINFNGNPTCINFKRSKKEDTGLIAVGSDADEIHLFYLDHENKPQPIVLQPKENPIKQDNTLERVEIIKQQQPNILIRTGKVLDVEFVKKTDAPWEKNIEVVVADASGELTVYCLLDNGNNRYGVYIAFTTDYNLNVEPGCMISCADNGEHMAVGCGDHGARVLKRINSSYEGSADDDTHDFWEEYAKIKVDHQILSVDISGDGERVAIATEAKVALVYDTKLGCKLNSYPSGGRVRSVCLDFDGSHLLVGGYDRKVVYYDNTSGFKPTLSLTKGAAVQSVSIDAEGKKLAVGLVNKKANVYSIATREELYSHKCKKMVYVVKLSTNGDLLAIGDYASTVTVVDFAEDEILFEIDFGKEQGSPSFIWGLDFIVMPHDDQSSTKTDDDLSTYRLAVGSWNQTAIVYDFDYDLAKVTPIHIKPTIVAEVKRNDRVFDVCLSADGKYLLVGGRDTVAALYSLSEEDRSKPLFEEQDDERIYCVALNPKATRLAFGGITKTIKVYEHKGEHPWGLLRTYKHDHTIQRMEFLDKEILAAISEDGKCGIYNVTSEAPILQLTYGDAGNSLAISKDGMLAVAHGHHVTVYGKDRGGYGIQDRPSLELATQMMDDPASLKIALKSYPTLANAHDKKNTTLLYTAVEQGKEEIVKCLLEGGCSAGLLMHKVTMMNPLMLALKKKNKGIIALLLIAINSDICSDAIVNSSALFESLFAGIIVEESITSKEEEKPAGSYTRLLSNSKRAHKITAFEMLGKNFPDLLLRFLSKIKLMPCEDQVLGDKKYMTLNEPLYVGLPLKAPQQFWQNYYADFKEKDDAFQQTNTPFLVQAYRIPIPGICGDSSLDGKKSKDGKQNIEEKDQGHASLGMLRMPSTSDVRTLHEEEDTHISPLEIIVNAARSQQDYNVFKRHTVVYALVKYKWKVLKKLFIFQYFLFLGYLFLCSWLSLTLSCYSTDSMSELFSNAWYAFPLSILLGLTSMSYLYQEWLQLKYEYQSLLHPDDRDKRFRDSFQATVMLKAIGAYISDDFWNLLDVSSFVTQLLTNICVWTRWSSTLGFASVSVLLLFGKIFFFARGFEQWGPFVRMIQRTMHDMKSFLMVMLVFFLGFALALDVFLGGNEGFTDLYESFFTVTLIVYGEFADVLTDYDGWDLATVLFEIYLLVSVIILLNLLVAIMSESFADVQENAANETMFELASIIVELEKVNTHTLAKQDKSNALFPKWVHVLKPVDEDFEEGTVDPDERMDSIETAMEQMNGKIDTLAKSLKMLQAEQQKFNKADFDH